MDPKKINKCILMGLSTSSALALHKGSTEKTKDLTITSNFRSNNLTPMQYVLNSNFETLAPSTSPLLFNQNLYKESSFDFVSSRLNNLTKTTPSEWHSKPVDDFYVSPNEAVSKSTSSINKTLDNMSNPQTTTVSDSILTIEPTKSIPEHTKPTIEFTKSTSDPRHNINIRSVRQKEFDYRVPPVNSFSDTKRSFLLFQLNIHIPLFFLGLNKHERSKFRDVIKLIFNVGKSKPSKNIDKTVDTITKTIDYALRTLEPNSKLARYLGVIKTLNLHNICKKYLTNKWSTLDVIYDLNLLQDNILAVADKKNVIKSAFLGGFSMITSGVACILFGVTATAKVIGRKFMSTAKLLANYIKTKTIDKIFKNITN